MKHPLDAVEWIDPKELRANGYNPNHVSPPEMELLKISILEDGWTQPIVARMDGEIVDGFHRWTLGSTDEDIRKASEGFVPVVRISDERSKEDQMMSTIRHNRARGNHAVQRMADIVQSLVENGLGEEEIMRRLGMEDEEVERLIDNSGMRKRGRSEGFNNGWVPEA
jgi:ParB-like chromosome segregation protein Spo0J